MKKTINVNDLNKILAKHFNCESVVVIGAKVDAGQACPIHEAGWKFDSVRSLNLNLELIQGFDLTHKSLNKNASVEFGTDCIVILENGREVMRWNEEEWQGDCKVVYAIARAIESAYRGTLSKELKHCFRLQINKK